MRVNNLDVGLRNTMTAVFRSKGLSEKAAGAKAAANLQAASDVFHAKCKGGPPLAKNLHGPAAVMFRGSPAAADHAMREVVRWAQSLK